MKTLRQELAAILATQSIMEAEEKEWLEARTWTLNELEKFIQSYTKLTPSDN